MEEVFIKVFVTILHFLFGSREVGTLTVFPLFSVILSEQRVNRRQTQNQVFPPTIHFHSYPSLPEDLISPLFYV